MRQKLAVQRLQLDFTDYLDVHHLCSRRRRHGGAASSSCASEGGRYGRENRRQVTKRNSWLLNLSNAARLSDLRGLELELLFINLQKGGGERQAAASSWRLRGLIARAHLRLRGSSANDVFS